MTNSAMPDKTTTRTKLQHAFFPDPIKVATGVITSTILTGHFFLTATTTNRQVGQILPIYWLANTVLFPSYLSGVASLLDKIPATNNMVARAAHNMSFSFIAALMPTMNGVMASALLHLMNQDESAFFDNLKVSAISGAVIFAFLSHFSSQSDLVDSLDHSSTHPEYQLYSMATCFCTLIGAYYLMHQFADSSSFAVNDNELMPQI